MPKSGKRASAGPRKPSSGFSLRKHGRVVARTISRSVQQSLSQFSASRMGSLPVPTLGGRQFWSDKLVFGGWRIQENVLTGHSRLLDARDVRRAWGTFAACLERFEQARARHRLAHNQDHVVVMVHGLLNAHGMFKGLGAWLKRRRVDSLSFNYASTRNSLKGHGKALCDILAHLGDVASVTFVTYSLGALVVRKALALGARPGGWRQRIRVRGLFMIAPPNRGARLAQIFMRGPVRWLAAPVASDLMPPRARRLPRPDVTYAIVAGGTGTPKGFNRLLAGDNDGCVTVAETRIAPDDDLILVKASHSLLVEHKATKKALARFLSGERISG